MSSLMYGNLMSSCVSLDFLLPKLITKLIVSHIVTYLKTLNLSFHCQSNHKYFHYYYILTLRIIMLQLSDAVVDTNMLQRSANFQIPFI